MVPSSANVPCMMGKAKSSGRNDPSASSRPGRVGSETRWTGCDATASRPWVVAASKSSGTTQRPAGVMPTGVTSYSSRSSMEETKRAEAREISCSAERPPKMRASLSMSGSLDARR